MEKIVFENLDSEPPIIVSAYGSLEARESSDLRILKLELRQWSRPLWELKQLGNQACISRRVLGMGNLAYICTIFPILNTFENLCLNILLRPLKINIFQLQAFSLCINPLLPQHLLMLGAPDTNIWQVYEYPVVKEVALGNLTALEGPRCGSSSGNHASKGWVHGNIDPVFILGMKHIKTPH